MNRNIVEQNIMNRMKELNMKQRDIVHITSMTRQQVSHYIHTRKYLGVYPLCQIAKALDCTVDRLLEGIDYDNTNN